MSSSEFSELDIAKNIATRGLLKSAEALSFFMKEKISLGKIECFIKKTEIEIPDLELKNDQDIYLLTTELIGELKGVCCLILNEAEASELWNRTFSPEMLSDQVLMAEMGNGLLLEVDNIVSASLITELSNTFGRKLYGGVPSLAKLKPNEYGKIIETRLREGIFSSCFCASFVLNDVGFEAQFVWFFEDSFFERVKDYAAELNSSKIL